MRRKKNAAEKLIPTIVRTHKIRIYPNEHNQEVFQKYYEYQRSVWNRAIDERNAQYKIYKEMKATGLFTQQELNKNYYPYTNNLRKMEKFDWEYNFYCRVREIQFDNLCRAWDNYFNPNMPNHKKPKYKKKKEIASCKKIALRGVRTNGKWLLLPNSRKSTFDYRFTKIKMSQKLRFDGKIVGDFSVSVENNKWYVTITVETPLEEKVALSKQSTGVDVNVGSIDYLKKDNGLNKEYGKFYLLPKSLLRQYDKIKYYSRIISKKRNKNSNYKRSKSYKEATAKLKDAYTKAYNIQEANLNNIVKYFFTHYNKIVIEDLNIKSMRMNRRLCKSLHRNAFGRFKRKMMTKAEEYDVEFVLANRYFPSTQTCSQCGHVKTGDEKLLLYGDKYGNDHNTYVCYKCGTIQDRTENAILNLANYKNNVN